MMSNVRLANCCSKISVTSVGNTVQAFLSLKGTSQVYAGATSIDAPSSTPPKTINVTPLQSRTFGTWTLLSSVVRLVAAYNINDPAMYVLAGATFVIASGHFLSEWLVFGTAKMGRGLAGPVVVAHVSLLWMFMQRGFYLQ